MKIELLNVWIVNLMAFALIKIFAPEQITNGLVGVMGQLIVILGHHSYYASQKKVRDVNYSFYLVTPLLAFFLGFLFAPILSSKFEFLDVTTWAIILGGLAEYTSEILAVTVKTLKGIIPFIISKAAGKNEQE